MYPIDVDAFLERAEEDGRPMSPTERELWKRLIELQNQAYAAGLQATEKQEEEKC